MRVRSWTPKVFVWRAQGNLPQRQTIRVWIHAWRTPVRRSCGTVYVEEVIDIAISVSFLVDSKLKLVHSWGEPREGSKASSVQILCVAINGQFRACVILWGEGLD